MKHSLLKFLCCVSCAGDLSFCGDDSSHENGEIISGILTCRGCGHEYSIIHGVPIFAPEALDHSITAKAFSEQWDKHKRGMFEKEDVFGLKKEDYLAHFCYAFDIERLEFLEGLTVEAGIGSGCLAVALAKVAPQNVVIGLDISNSVFSLSATANELPNLHLIQCDLVNPPLRKGLADRAYSSGVLHHLASPPDGVRSLWSLVGMQGKLYFWVYPSYVFCAYDVLRRKLGRPYQWPGGARFFFSWLFSPFMWAYFFVTKRHSYKQSQESLRTVAFRILDNISPEFQHQVSKDDIETWAKQVGIGSYQIINDLGVRCSHGF